MRINYDPEKRALTLGERGLDFEDAPEAFERVFPTRIDDREDYPEIRFITYAELRGRMVVVVWTVVSGARRILSMRKANGREQARIGLGGSR